MQRLETASTIDQAEDVRSCTPSAVRPAKSHCILWLTRFSDPDVSALGQHIEQSDYTYEGPDGAGTSASTPIFASVLTRINEERLRAGKKTVGFVNPVLVSNSNVAALFA